MVFLASAEVPRATVDQLIAEARLTYDAPLEIGEDLMRFEIARTRRIYAAADTGLAFLPSRSARCVATARLLYSRILDRIEAADYDVFTRRARVPAVQKSAVAIAALLRPAGVRAAPTARV